MRLVSLKAISTPAGTQLTLMAMEPLLFLPAYRLSKTHVDIDPSAALCNGTGAPTNLHIQLQQQDFVQMVMG